MQCESIPLPNPEAKPFVYGSICSGIEAASVAWHPLGWTPAFFSELDAFPRAVLQHHYQHVQCHGDFTTIKEVDYAAIDLLVGGTPCQAFSVAGLRKGFADERGNLTLEFVRLAQRLKPRWLVWENVPGVLSIDRGRAFGSFLGGLAECGYGFAYRVLDAQHFGVPQRRRRVFVVGHLGDWRPPAAVLFEREGLQWDLTPSRETREGTACGFETGPHGGSLSDLAPTLDTRCKDGPVRNQLGIGVFVGLDAPVHALRAEGFDASEDGTGRGTPLVPVAFNWQGGGTQGSLGFDPTSEKTGSLQAKQTPAIAFAQNTRDEVRLVGGDGSIVGALAAEPGMKQQSYVAFDLRGREGGSMPEGPHETANIRAASGGSSRSYLAGPLAVRRLTPMECERLQGFPDSYTAVPYRGKTAADGPRYKALGNSMAVPCMRWIGERIQMVEELRDQPAVSGEAA